MKKRITEKQIIGVLRANGRRIKVLTIVDDFTKEFVDLVAEHGISGHHVVRVLERAAQFCGLPSALRTDQGPEFTGKALDQWGYQNGVQLKLMVRPHE